MLDFLQVAQGQDEALGVALALPHQEHAASPGAASPHSPGAPGDTPSVPIPTPPTPSGALSPHALLPDPLTPLYEPWDPITLGGCVCPRGPVPPRDPQSPPGAYPSTSPWRPMSCWVSSREMRPWNQGWVRWMAAGTGEGHQVGPPPKAGTPGGGGSVPPNPILRPVVGSAHRR